MITHSIRDATGSNSSDVFNGTIVESLARGRTISVSG